MYRLDIFGGFNIQVAESEPNATGDITTGSYISQRICRQLVKKRFIKVIIIPGVYKE